MGMNINMQDNYVNMRLIMQHIYVDMQHNMNVNMRDNDVNMRLKLCCKQVAYSNNYLAC